MTLELDENLKTKGHDDLYQKQEGLQGSKSLPIALFVVFETFGC